MKSKFPVLCGSILICELFIVYFAVLTAYGLAVKTAGSLSLSQLLLLLGGAAKGAPFLAPMRLQRLGCQLHFCDLSSSP